MATYYKYADRDADSQVNWAAVGKDMSDMLAETNRVREEKKAAIDQATRESLLQLAQSPQGENENARSEILRYASNASEMVKIQDRLLKSGELSLKDYTIFRQNLNDGTNLAFNANKAYQEQYAQVMNDDTLSDLVKQNFAEVEGYGNWNQSGLYINKNGTVMAALKTKKVIDGKEVYTMDGTPGNMQSVDAINQMIYGKIKKFDYVTPTKEFADNLGVEEMSVVSKSGLFKQGYVLKTDDITKRTDLTEDEKSILFKFADAEKQAIEAMIGTDTNYATLLIDRVNYNKDKKLYDTTYSKEEADKNPNLILKVFDPKSGGHKYEISDAQKEEGREFMRNQMRAQYDKKSDVNMSSQLSRNDKPVANKDADDADKEIVNTAQMIGTLWGGANGATIAKATTAFRDINPNIEKVDRTVRGVTVTLKGPDGKLQKRELPFYGTDGKLMTQEQFILSAGPLLGGNADYLSAVKRGGFIKNAKFNDKDEEFSEVTREAPPVKAKTVNVSDDLFTDSDEGASATLITQKLRGAGLPIGKVGEANKWTVDPTGGYDDEVTITAPSGDTYSYSSDGNAEKRAADKAGLAKFIEEQQAP